MMKKLLILAVMLFTTVSVADPATLQELSDKLSQIQTMQADYLQTIRDDNGRTLQESTGSMALQRPGKFRWETKTPMEQLLIADGEHIWVYDIDLEQVTIRPMDDSDKNKPGYLLSGSVDSLSHDFEVEKMDRPGRLTWYKLTPKEDSGLFAEVQMGFSGDTLQSMDIIDELSQTTEVRFSKEKVNSRLKSDMFVFHMPPDVDVIKADS